MGPRAHQTGQASWSVSRNPPAFASPVLRLGVPPCRFFFFCGGGTQDHAMQSKSDHEASLTHVVSCGEFNVKKGNSWNMEKNRETGEEAAEQQGWEAWAKYVMCIWKRHNESLHREQLLHSNKREKWHENSWRRLLQKHCKTPKRATLDPHIRAHLDYSVM